MPTPHHTTPTTTTGELVVLVGPAGAGKSTWATRHADAPTHIVSLDTLRAWVSDDAATQTATPAAVTLARILITARLRRGRPVILDSTATQAHHRHQWAALAARTGASATLVVFTTPLMVCLHRNHQRPTPTPGHRWGPRVPDPVVRAQHAATIRLAAHLAAGGTVPGYHHTHLVGTP